MTAAPAPRPRRRPSTTTARFGSSRRESHDASGFYDRFVAPELSGEETVNAHGKVDVIYRHDARDMRQVPDDSVALVVTSPPYFAGKEYEESLGQNGVPATYFEYLALLRDVFDECRRVLEPGGRIAVNVANLGRRPYRSLAGDVTTILSELGLLLRGEVVWWKGKAAGGSCAWGTFQKAANPVLRDVTERVVIASKGRFDRAVAPHHRLARDMPARSTITRDEFLEATTDLWEIPPESATRVGHPAPFPVELPRRLIELYTYEGDVVLDPFMGSGTTAVAAVRSGRHYVGFDTDASYVAAARGRLVGESATRSPGRTVGGKLAEALAEGRTAKEAARALLEDCGFRDIRAEVKIPQAGMDVAFVAVDVDGRQWAFDVCGAFTAARTGLRKAETLWRAIGRAAVLAQSRPELPLVLLATEGPTGAGKRSLAAASVPGGPVADVIVMLDAADRARLAEKAAGVAGGR